MAAFDKVTELVFDATLFELAAEFDESAFCFLPDLASLSILCILMNFLVLLSRTSFEAKWSMASTPRMPLSLACN